MPTAATAKHRSKTASRSPGYHHGDLREVLLDLALAHIAGEGTEALSLRALAREAGVSATAPYRHFDSKTALIAGVAARGFRQLAEAVAAGFASQGSLESRMLAGSRAYVGFATGNPTAYQLMFGTVIGDFSEQPELAEAAEASYQPVLTFLGELITKRRLNTSPEYLSGVVWAVVHGLSSLLITRLSKPGDMPASPLHAIEALGVDLNATLKLMYGNLLLPEGGSRTLLED